MGLDTIALLQTMILGVTGVIVAWYTYETRIIRLETARQAAVGPSSKLWDRQNELDKLMLGNPAVAKAFMSMANRPEPYFGSPVAQVPRDDLYCQLKAFVYMQLNFFEEIFLTTSASTSVARQFEREQWNEFIFQYMRHSLLREVFQAEKNKAYTGEFVRFLDRHVSRWGDGQADEDLF